MSYLLKSCNKQGKPAFGCRYNPLYLPSCHAQWGDVYQGWVLAFFFFVDAWLLGVSLQRMTAGCTKVGISMRASITNTVCKKAFAMVSPGTAISTLLVPFDARFRVPTP